MYRNVNISAASSGTFMCDVILSPDLQSVLLVARNQRFQRCHNINFLNLSDFFNRYILTLLFRHIREASLQFPPYSGTNEVEYFGVSEDRSLLNYHFQKRHVVFKFKVFIRKSL